jgi:hypothetical protein
LYFARKKEGVEGTLMEKHLQWRWNENVYPDVYYCERYLWSHDGSKFRDWINLITLVPLMIVGFWAMVVGAGSSPHPSSMMRVGGLVLVLSACSFADHYTASAAGPVFLLTAAAAVTQVELVGWTLDTIDALHYYLRPNGHRPGVWWHMLTFITRVIMYGTIIAVIAALGMGADPHAVGMILPVVGGGIAVPFGMAIVADESSAMDYHERAMSKIAIVVGSVQVVIMITGAQWCTPTSATRYFVPHAIEHICAAITLHLVIVTTQLLEDRWRAVRWEAALHFAPWTHVHKTDSGKSWLHQVPGNLVTGNVIDKDAHHTVLSDEAITPGEGAHAHTLVISIPPPPSHILRYKCGWFPYLSVAPLTHTNAVCAKRSELLHAMQSSKAGTNRRPPPTVRRTAMDCV